MGIILIGAWPGIGQFSPIKYQYRIGWKKWHQCITKFYINYKSYNERSGLCYSLYVYHNRLLHAAEQN